LHERFTKIDNEENNTIRQGIRLNQLHITEQLVIESLTEFGIINQLQCCNVIPTISPTTTRLIIIDIVHVTCIVICTKDITAPNVTDRSGTSQ